MYKTKSANPYLPLWEHIPDGEPRVFEFEGEKRVYIYGSHDTLRTGYCGLDYVVWSAPADDLTDWRYDGICYTSPDGNPLYAPDVVQKGDTFYLYAAENCNSRITVSKSKNPAGPFTDAVVTQLGADVGVLVDDDGRAYAYWGFGRAICAELEEDMATVKPDTVNENFIGHCVNPWTPHDEYENIEDGFFEAASIRKIFGKYVLIYSKCTSVPATEYGVDHSTSMLLSYKYGDHPLKGYKSGGDICYNCGEIIDRNGAKKATYRDGNNHGSLAEINGKWYIFYHRHTNNNEFSRQAMVEPVEVELTPNGELFIGKIIREKGVAVAAEAVEMTSQGANTDGIDAYSIIAAAYTCHISGENQAAFVKTTYSEDEKASVTNITDGTVVGFRYLQFGSTPPRSVKALLFAKTDMDVNIRVGGYNGEIVATMSIKPGDTVAEAVLSEEVVGKQAVYFEFLAENKEKTAEFYEFGFLK